MENLTHLDLFNNPLGSEDDYRNRVFNLIPGLKYLDGADENNVDVDEEASEDGENLNGNADDDDDEDEEEDVEDEDDEDGGWLARTEMPHCNIIITPSFMLSRRRGWRRRR